MKYITLIRIFSLSLLFLPFLLSAHEEPAKTTAERQIKLDEAKRIKKLGIKSSLSWKYRVENGKATRVKTKYLETRYTEDGFLHELILFDSTGSVLEKVEYGYDGNSNMITDNDYDSEGKLAEWIEYEYDSLGRVVSGKNYAGDTISALFDYRQNKERKSVEFYKFLNNLTLDYRIDYYYQDYHDDPKISTAYKFHPGIDTMMFVKYQYFPFNKVREKQIFDGKMSLLYTFFYHYDRKRNRKEIRKVMPGGKTEYVQKFDCDKNGNVKRIVVVDSSGKMISMMENDFFYH